jgi:hypothetical protein
MPDIPLREPAALLLVEADGADLWLSLARSDGSRVSVILGVAESVALAADLLQAARVRCGRQDWPSKAEAPVEAAWGHRAGDAATAPPQPAWTYPVPVARFSGRRRPWAWGRLHHHDREAGTELAIGTDGLQWIVLRWTGGAAIGRLNAISGHNTDIRRQSSQ